jgi:hypothetical protein
VADHHPRDFEFMSSLAVRLADPAAQEVLTDAAAVSKAKSAEQETAGAVAESELAKEFASYGKRQELVGYIWLAVAAGLFAFTVFIAAGCIEAGRAGVQLVLACVAFVDCIAMPRSWCLLHS